MERPLSRALPLLAASLLFPVFAHAGAFRTYVASYGQSTNPCTVSQPCRLVSDALPLTLDGGEIWILDSANFNSGTVNIDRSVNIMAVPGQVGSIVSVGGAPAISISTPSVKVRLRNLFIVDNANNHGTDGVNVAAAGVTLTMDDCVMWVQNDAVVVNGLNSSVTVLNSRILGASHGVHVLGGGSAEVVKTEFANIANYGAYADGSVASTVSTMTVRDSSFTNMYLGAIAVSVVAASTVRLYMTGSTVTNSNYGLLNEQDAGTAVSYAGGNTFANVIYGLIGYSGTTYSFGNNMNSGSNGNYGTITPASQS